MTLKLEITGHKCFEDRRDDMSIDLKHYLMVERIIFLLYSASALN